MTLFYNKTFERKQQELGAFIWWKTYEACFWRFSSSVGVKHFWVDLDGRHVFTPTPSVGVGHMWVVCT